VGFRPVPINRRRGRAVAAAAGAVPGLSGDACVVAGGVAAAQGYLAGVVWAAVAARAGGDGHRRIGVGLSVPSSTVRGWLRRAAGRLEAVRTVFLQHAVTAGVDVRIPASQGSAWADLVAAVAVAAGSLSVRFSSGLGSGALSFALVASAGSGV